jgi:hypothetical protein
MFPEAQLALFVTAINFCRFGMGVASCGVSGIGDQSGAVSHPLPASTDRALFLQVGNDLAKANGDDSWLLPAPATFVIAGDVTSRHARVGATSPTGSSPATSCAPCGCSQRDQGAATPANEGWSNRGRRRKCRVARPRACAKLRAPHEWSRASEERLDLGEARRGRSGARALKRSHARSEAKTVCEGVHV